MSAFQELGLTAVVASAVSTLGPAAATYQQATFSFITATSLDTTNELIFNFLKAPGEHFIALESIKFGNVGSITTSTFANPVVTVTLSGRSTLAAGPVTVTCSGLHLKAYAASEGKAPQGADCGTGLLISTTKDTIPIYISLPAVGAISVQSLASPDFTTSFASQVLQTSVDVEMWSVASSSSVAGVVLSFTRAEIALVMRFR
jgi:hypothetical protein